MHSSAVKKRLIHFFKLIALILTAAALCSALFACVSNGDGNETKPDIGEAMANYEKLTMKKSKLDAEFKLTLFGGKPGGKLKLYSLGEWLDLTRILNDGKIYMNGSARALDTTKIPQKDSFLQIIDSPFLKLVMGNELSEIKAHLESKTSFDYKAGYQNSSYNAKARYVDIRETNFADTPWVWGATDDESLNGFLTEHGIIFPDGLYLSDYMMFSNFIDLTRINDFLPSDKAVSSLSAASKTFVYDFILSESKIKSYIVALINEMAAMFGLDEYGDQLEKFEKLLPYIDKWLAVSSPTCYSQVGNNGLPVKLETALGIELRIPLSDITEVADIFELSEENRNLVDVAVILAGNLFSDRFGDMGTSIDIRFDLKISETFKYSASECSLSSADPDMFKPYSDIIEERFEFPRDFNYSSLPSNSVKNRSKSTIR